MKIRSMALAAMGLVLFFLPVGSAAAGEARKPRIVKHGTIDLDLVEATPIVFQDRLYRFEYVRQRYKPNTTGDSYFRFIDVQTEKPTPGVYRRNAELTADALWEVVSGSTQHLARFGDFAT